MFILTPPIEGGDGVAVPRVRRFIGWATEQGDAFAVATEDGQAGLYSPKVRS
jgi:hypothetical protein